MCLTNKKITQYLLRLKKHDEIIETVGKCLDTFHCKQITIHQSSKIKKNLSSQQSPWERTYRLSLQSFSNKSRV